MDQRPPEGGSRDFAWRRWSDPWKGPKRSSSPIYRTNAGPAAPDRFTLIDAKPFKFEVFPETAYTKSGVLSLIPLPLVEK